MNDPHSTPPPILPGTPAPDPKHLPLGANPAEQAPVVGVFGAIEALLRQPRRVLFQLRQSGGALITALVLVAVVAAAIYGVVVGTFSGGSQLWAAPAKIVVGLLLSGLICLPSLYIFSCLGGSQARLIEVCGLVAGLLALMTILLIGFAPVAWVFSQSIDSLAAMGALHLGFWFIATYFGVRFLSAGFRLLGERAGGGLNVWVIIFLLVMLQMTTALRPILGRSDQLLTNEKKFFLSHWAECLKMTDEGSKTRLELRRQ